MNDTPKERLKEKPGKKTSPKKEKNIAFFKQNYFINLDKELSEYSTEDVKAYETGTSRENMTGYITMVCPQTLLSRTDIAKYYQDLSSQNMPTLIDHGRGRRENGNVFYCYIYKNDLGKKLHEKDDDIALGAKTDNILENIIIPIVQSLTAIQQREMVHGNIRITNLYAGISADNDKIMLGECLSAPASYNQPVIFEPVERAMATPIGRGDGTIKDDLYSLGVVLAMYARNFDPMRGKKDEEIIASKIVQGSYNTLIGPNDRIASGMTNIIRGLLTDNHKNRWSLSDINDWLEGRNVNAQQPIRVKKASRSLEFDGKNFLYARTLAYRMSKNQQEAMTLIENNELAHWIKRSLGNNEISDRFELAISTDQDNKSVQSWDRLLTRVSIAMDPAGPIHYKSLSFHMDSLGNTIADLFLKNKEISHFIEAFNNGVIYFWLNVMAEMNKDVTSQFKLFDKIKNYLRQDSISNGPERCLYELSSSIHCLSPNVIDFFPINPNEYLIALDRFAEKNKNNLPTKIIDKHGACFLISRDRSAIEPYLYDLNHQEKYRYIMATINILNKIQSFSSSPPTPHLIDWILQHIDPIIGRYHDNMTREQIQRDIEKKKQTGIIADILKALENPKQIQKDQLAFKKALISYKELDNEAVHIEEKMENPRLFSERKGREWAATISGVISTIIILGFIMLHYNGGG